VVGAATQTAYQKKEGSVRFRRSHAALPLAASLLLVTLGLVTGCGQSATTSQTSPTPTLRASPQPLAGYRLWASGTRVFTSADGGATWRVQRTLDGLSWGIAASDARHVWFATDGGEILATSDGGAHWALQRRNTNNRELAGVACSDARHVFAAGTAPGGVFVLRTSNGGRTWISSPLVKQLGSLMAIACSDARHVWAVGSPHDPASGTTIPGAIIASSDGGVHWKVQYSEPNANLRGVAFADARCGWAVGDETVAGAGAEILRTTDGGASWTMLHLPEVACLQGVTCSDATHAWAVGGAMDASRAVIVATADGGKTWKAQWSLRAGAGPRVVLAAVSCTDSRHVWAIGMRGHAVVVLATSNGGATWTTQSARPSMGLLLAITVSRPLH
jgi:photosystem II stability/assembly factor-like uncharacterized protein